MNEITFKLPVEGTIHSTGERHLANTLDIVAKQLNTFYGEEIKIGFFNGKTRRADFYIRHKSNIFLFEFDGIQHYQAVSKFGGDTYLSEIRKRDKWENLISKESNNIYLIRYKVLNSEASKPHTIKLNYQQIINFITPEQVIKDMEKAQLGAFVQNGRLYHSRYR